MCPTLQKGRNLVNKRGNYFERRGKLETSVLRKQLIIIQDHQVFFFVCFEGSNRWIVCHLHASGFCFCSLTTGSHLFHSSYLASQAWVTRKK